MTDKGESIAKKRNKPPHVRAGLAGPSADFRYRRNDQAAGGRGRTTTPTMLCAAYAGERATAAGQREGRGGASAHVAW